MGIHNTYSIDYYISLGYSVEDAYSKVEENRHYTSIGIRNAAAKKRIIKNNYTNISPDELMYWENVIMNSPNGIKDLLNLKPIIKNLMKSLSLSTLDSFKLYKKTLDKFPDIKRPSSSVVFLKELYGEDSKEYKNRVKINASILSCSFENFSAGYEDKIKAYEDFREKYGSNNINALCKKYGVTKTQARSIQKHRSDKMLATNAAKPEEERLLINAKKSINLDNFIKKYGDVVGPLKYKEVMDKRKGQCGLEYYINKFGVEVGTIKHKEHCNTFKRLHTLEYWIEKGMSDDEAKKQLEKIFKGKGTFSKKFCVEKYGETEGIRIWKLRTDMWQATLNAKPQHEKDAMNRKKALTLENQILKYGDVLGKENYTKSFAGRSDRISYSKESRNFFLKIYKKLRKLGYLNREDIHFGVSGSKEYFLHYDGGTKWYDFCIPRAGIIIEYNGSAFHPQEGDVNWKSAFGVSYDEIRSNDIFKKNLAEKNGYDVHYVWDHDDKEELVNYLLLEIIDGLE